MELKIVINISLTDDELIFLRKYFENKEGIIIGHTNKPSEKEKNAAIDLVVKKIVKIDSFSTISLTEIGKQVMDLIDRDKRIETILNK